MGGNKREAVVGKSMGWEHHVAGAGVGTLWRKPRLAKSQADRRTGWKEMCGGISQQYVTVSELQKMVLE